MPADVEALFVRYGPMVVRRCRAMLGDDQRAAEATQEVFTRLWAKRIDVEHPSALLYQMATYECLMQLRAARRHPASPSEELLARIAELPDVDARLDAAAALDWLFSREPPDTRVIATMFLLDGMTWEQIASEVGMSVSGVRKRVRRLRGHLPELEAR